MKQKEEEQILLEKKINSLNKKLSNYQNNTNTHDYVFSRLEARIESLSKEKTNFQKKTTELQNQIKTKENTIEGLKEQNQKTKTELNSLKISNEELKNKILEKEDSLKHILGKYNELSVQLNNNLQDQTIINDKTGLLSTKLDSLNKVVNYKNQEIKELTNRNISYNENISTLEEIKHNQEYTILKIKQQKDSLNLILQLSYKSRDSLISELNNKILHNNQTKEANENKTGLEALEKKLVKESKKNKQLQAKHKKHEKDYKTAKKGQDSLRMILKNIKRHQDSLKSKIHKQDSIIKSLPKNTQDSISRAEEKFYSRIDEMLQKETGQDYFPLNYSKTKLSLKNPDYFVQFISDFTDYYLNKKRSLEDFKINEYFIIYLDTLGNITDNVPAINHLKNS